VNSALGWVACSLPADERSPIQLCPVEIQSRIGSQYLLSLTYPMKSAFSKSEAASSPRYQLILEKADVLAWSPGRNFCDSSQPSDPAASAVAGQQSEAPNPQTAASTPSAPIAANAASGPPPSSVASFKGAVTQPQVTSGSATNVAVSISGTLTIQAPHAIHKPPANSAVHRPVRCVQPSPCCGSVERCEGVVGSGPVSQNTRAASEPL